MPPELAARVFDLFVQGEREPRPRARRARHRPHAGAPPRRAARRHARARTATGTDRGSEFTVRLPAIAPPAARAGARRRRPRRRSRPRHPRRRGQRRRARDAAPAARARRATGCSAARRRRRGRSRPRCAAQPEVALVDVGLPSIDGYEVARRIRAAGRRRAAVPRRAHRLRRCRRTASARSTPASTRTWSSRWTLDEARGACSPRCRLDGGTAIPSPPPGARRPRRTSASRWGTAPGRRGAIRGAPPRDRSPCRRWSIRPAKYSFFREVHVHHAVQPLRLVAVALAAVRDLVLLRAHEVVRLAEHRARRRPSGTSATAATSYLPRLLGKNLPVFSAR